MTADRRTRGRAFVDHLHGLTGRDGRERDRAALAALRRAGDGPGHAPEADRLLLRWVDPDNPWDDQHIYLVAGLFARYPEAPGFGEAARASDLGVSFWRVKEATGSDSIEKRFMALLTAGKEDLGEHLRHAVSLMRAHDAPVDWEHLLTDLRAWDRDDRRVQGRWARSFWGAAAAAENNNDNDTTNTNEGVTPNAG